MSTGSKKTSKPTGQPINACANSNKETPSKNVAQNRDKRDRSSPGETSSAKSTKSLSTEKAIAEESDDLEGDKITPGLMQLINTIVDKATKPLVALIKEQRASIENLTQTLQDFVSSESSSQENIRLLTEENIKIKLSLADQAHTIINLSHRIDKAEMYLDEQEQYSRRESLRFRNIPLENIPTRQIKGDRSILDTDKFVVDFCTRVLNQPITVDDVDRSHVVGKRNYRGQVNIICKFANYRAKSRIYHSRMSLKNRREKVFIVEDLTHYRVRLVGKLNELRKNKNITSFWTSDGRVFYKTTMTSEPVLVKSLDDIQNAFPVDL